jgi:hypothetical protein
MAAEQRDCNCKPTVLRTLPCGRSFHWDRGRLAALSAQREQPLHQQLGLKKHCLEQPFLFAEHEPD